MHRLSPCSSGYAGSARGVHRTLEFARAPGCDGRRLRRALPAGTSHLRRSIGAARARVRHVPGTIAALRFRGRRRGWPVRISRTERAHAPFDREGHGRHDRAFQPPDFRVRHSCLHRGIGGATRARAREIAREWLIDAVGDLLALGHPDAGQRNLHMAAHQACLLLQCPDDKPCSRPRLKAASSYIGSGTRRSSTRA
jgi:hypothetical protein